MPETAEKNDRASGLNLAEILKDISSGEQAASLLEQHLSDLESKIDSLLEPQDESAGPTPENAYANTQSSSDVKQVDQSKSSSK